MHKPIRNRFRTSKTCNFPENPPDISEEWETINLNELDKKDYRKESISVWYSKKKKWDSFKNSQFKK